MSLEFYNNELYCQKVLTLHFLSLSVFLPFLCVHMCFRCILYLHLFFSLSVRLFAHVGLTSLRSLFSGPVSVSVFTPRVLQSRVILQSLLFPVVSSWLELCLVFVFLFSLFFFHTACFVSVAWILHFRCHHSSHY